MNVLRIRLIAPPVLVLALVRCADGRHEWSTIDLLKPAAGTLDRALRLLDKRGVANCTTTIFVGPVRLITRP